MAEAKAPAARKRATPAKPAAAKSATKTANAKTLTKKPLKTKAVATAETLQDQASSFKDKAGDKARDYANTGKTKATNLLDSLSQTVDDLARTVDKRLGTNYGDYARKAASAVSDVADTLKGKEVDDIVADTRDFVRKQPVVAIGAAAAVGFLLTRLFKAGTNHRDDA